MTSFFRKEMNLRIPLCYVRYLNGILRNLSENDALTEQNTWETTVISEILNVVM